MVHGGNLNQAKGGQACVSLYEAGNDELTNWKFKSILFTDTNSANIECPNFFPLGDKFVLITSPHRRCDYFVGAFDAEAGRFIEESRGLVDGTDAFYAPNGLVDPRGRRIFWGWIRGFKGGRGWNGCMSVPRLLSLSDGRLVQQPAPELTKLRADHHREHNLRLAGTSCVVSKVQGDTLEIAATFLLGDAKNAGLRLRRSTDGHRALEIKYDGVSLDVAGTQLSLPSVSTEKRLKLQVFLDRSVLEVFANDGRACITRVVYPEEHDQGIELFATGGLAKVESFDVWRMKSIW
jgi:beta-fructofuranosidase